MVKEPTLLVLGAGASLAYGFPLGPELLRQIAEELSKVEVASEIAALAEVPQQKVHSFSSELLSSRRLSIDAFIESRAADYDLIGRLSIARHLLRLESDSSLFPSLQEDWYTHLFDAILGNSANAFRGNNLRILTFNFDRSFERALYLALSANFPNDDVDTMSFHAIPILHVHGDLGFPAWQKRYVIGGGRMREYAPSQDAVTVMNAAQNIKIVHHGITDGTAQVIKDFFEWASRVFFVGFSYHEANLRKLGVPGVLIDKAVLGTVFGMGNGALSRMRRHGHGLIIPTDSTYTAVDAIRETDWFYE